MKDINDKVVMKTSEDVIKIFEMGNRTVFFYTEPYGKKQINEICDVVYHFKNYKLPYHYHDCGAVTYLILKGRIEFVINGRKCICEEEDIINIPSHCPYGMTILEKDSMVREVYTEIGALETYCEYELAEKAGLPHVYDKKFSTEFEEKHHFFVLTEPAETEIADKKSFHQISEPGKSIYEYKDWEGIICNLKVARWDLKRSKEIWEYNLKKDYQMQYFIPNENQHIYSIKSGKVMIEVNEDVYFAEKNDIIKISSYTPFTITAVEENTVIYDLNVSARLFRMLEMLELAQRDEQEKIKDEEWIKELLKLNDSYLTGFVKVDCFTEKGA